MQTENRFTTSQLLGPVVAIIIVVILVLMIASFPVGLYAVFFTKLSNSTTYAEPVYGITLLLALFPLTIPFATTVGGLFIILSSVYAAFFTLAAFQGMKISTAIKEIASSGYDKVFANPLVATTITLGALTFAVTILDLIQTRSGIPTGQISGDPLNLFMGITLAPITEELGFRFALIGIPIFAAAILSRSSLKAALKSLWRPSASLDESSGHSGALKIRRIFAYALLGISSVLFGLAHYLSNAGWNVGKVSEAAVAGVALGYLYMRYGFHANVLLHWGVNYFGTAYAFFTQGVWGIPWTSDTGSALSLAVQLVTLVFLGFPSFCILLYKFLKRVGGSGELEAS